MNSTFKKNLLLGFGISLFLLIVSAAASYISIRNLLKNQELVTQTNNILKRLDGILGNLVDAETGQRGFLLTGRENFLEPYRGAQDELRVTMSEIKPMLSDDEQQTSSIIQLEKIANERLQYLQTLIDNKKLGKDPAPEQFEDGKKQMDMVRSLVQQIQNREKLRLISRTETMDRFAVATPLLILVAALLSLVVTIISFVRLNNDFEKRIELQQELITKDREINERLILIQSIAEKISSGDYKTRVNDAGADVLGSLAVSLNKMAGSLDKSFEALSHQEWLQSGIAALNEQMIGEKNLQHLAEKSISYVADYTQAVVGAFYLPAGENALEFVSGFALDKKTNKRYTEFGEGVAGQCAAALKTILVDELEDNRMDLLFGGGTVKPNAIIAVPVFYEGKLKAVIELATLKSFTPIMQEFLRGASFNIGMAIHSARDHIRLEELLAETQAQSEELQAQHTELENINAELEAQAEKLQSSEEELRVQQEELQQSNSELEERSRELEEKNELVLERNLDIQRKVEELALSTKYKSEFLANMSHELRTPLNSILLLSRLLSENHPMNLNNDQIEYANVIQSSGKGLLMLIDEILDLSKIESGKMELQLEQVNLRDMGEELRQMFTPLAKDKNIDFIVNIDDQVSHIETDQLRLEQILRNLISNALKFTKKGNVTVDISRNQHAFKFSVKDTGIGIPKDKQQTIFEAFQQADGSTRRQYGGTGLGLSISKELAKLLGGKITLASEPNAGSEFILELPLHREKSAKPVETNQKTTDILPEYPVAPKPVGGNDFIAENIPASIPDDRDDIEEADKIILIIEDDTAFAHSLLEYTRNRGYKGVVAVRGDEGIALAKQFMPVGILLDLQLPVKSGWQVMDELKADPVTRPIPVHMMSSFEAKNKSLTKGAIDFINKPVAFEKLGEIFRRIEDALSRHPKKVMIVEENTKHAKALAYFLESFAVNAEIKSNVADGIDALNRSEIDCVILDMGIPTQHSYDTLEAVKKAPGFENLPIIIFTGKNLSHVEEMKIKQYADSIVIKTAHSYQRILDEVSLFLHLVEENKKPAKTSRYKKLGELGEVLKGKNVLVADDDVRNIFSLTKSLENYGINVISATDGKEALAQLEKASKVDLILMDMMMPEMDGYETTSKIRKNPKYRQLPIIAVTAKAMTGDREKCISAGASDYITKPVDVDQLLSLLRVWLYD